MEISLLIFLINLPILCLPTESVPFSSATQASFYAALDKLKRQRSVANPANPPASLCRTAEERSPPMQ
jgi:hypothetical protein